jgi:hypothetical protein
MPIWEKPLRRQGGPEIFAQVFHHTRFPPYLRAPVLPCGLCFYGEKLETV